MSSIIWMILFPVTSGRSIGEEARGVGSGLLQTIFFASSIAFCKFCCFLNESLLLQCPICELQRESRKKRPIKMETTYATHAPLTTCRHLFKFEFNTASFAILRNLQQKFKLCTGVSIASTSKWNLRFLVVVHKSKLPILPP